MAEASTRRTRSPGRDTFHMHDLPRHVRLQPYMNDASGIYIHLSYGTLAYSWCLLTAVLARSDA
jgi:hypothetical protein